MMTICSKFGIRGFGVVVGVEEGIGVSVVVGRTGAGVNVAEGKGTEVSVDGTGRGVQATNKTRRIQKQKRFIKISILAGAFGVL